MVTTFCQWHYSHVTSLYIHHDVLLITDNLKTMSPEMASNGIAFIQIWQWNPSLKFSTWNMWTDMTSSMWTLLMHNMQKICNKATQIVLNFKNTSITLAFGFSWWWLQRQLAQGMWHVWPGRSLPTFRGTHCLHLYSWRASQASIQQEEGCRWNTPDCCESLPPGNTAAAAGLRGIPNMLAMSSTGLPVSTHAPVSATEAQLPCLEDAVQVLG
jgi:hypothetical protein